MRPCLSFVLVFVPVAPKMIRVFVSFSLMPFIIFVLFCSISLSLDVNGSRVPEQALAPPPRDRTCLHFCPEKTFAFSSLVGSHRIAPTRAARRSQQLISVCLVLFLQVN